MSQDVSNFQLTHIPLLRYYCMFSIYTGFMLSTQFINKP